MLFRYVALAYAVLPAAASDGQLRTRQHRGKLDDDCTFKGNGFPQGKAAFHLKLLGRDMGKRDEWNFNPQGDNAIAIKLNQKTQISLENSDEVGTDCHDQCPEDFCVADPNGTDGKAKLCLRDPFPDSNDPCINDGDASCDEPAVYRIFARVRGKGNMNVQTCVEDTSEGGTFRYCDIGNSVTFSRKKAADVSQQLLTICYGDVGIGLFDELCFDGEGNLITCDGNDTSGIEEQYFWDVDNQGVRNAELRFYDQAYLNSLVDGTGCTWDDVTRGECRS